MPILKNSPFEKLRQVNSMLDTQSTEAALRNMIGEDSSQKIANQPLTVKDESIKKIYSIHNCWTQQDPNSLDLDRLEEKIKNLIEHTGENCLFAFNLIVPSRCVVGSLHAIPLIFNKEGKIFIPVSISDYESDIKTIAKKVQKILTEYNHPHNKTETPLIPQNDKTICGFYTLLALNNFSENGIFSDEVERISQNLKEAMSSSEKKLELQNNIVDRIDADLINEISSKKIETCLFEGNQDALTETQSDILIEALKSKLNLEYYEVNKQNNLIYVREIKAPPRGTNFRPECWQLLNEHFEVTRTNAILMDENENLEYVLLRSEISHIKDKEALKNIVGKENLFSFLKPSTSYSADPTRNNFFDFKEQLSLDIQHLDSNLSLKNRL